MSLVAPFRSHPVAAFPLEEDAFEFCPYDGKRLTPSTAGDTRRGAKCPGCGFVDFQNPRPCVGVIIERDSKILLARRGLDPAAGMWDLPGGFIDAGEAAEDSVRREIREETGLVLEDLRYVWSIADTYGPSDDVPKPVPTLNLIFRARVRAGDAQADSDVRELRWFSVAELPADLAFTHQREALKRYREES
jgi:NADH pyrophosphatase NudC (nudix superfamily)